MKSEKVGVSSIVHVITETNGGAGIAARRLHQGLLSEGMNSHLIYRRGYCTEQNCRRIDPALKIQWRILEKINRYWLEKCVKPCGGLFTNIKMPFPTPVQLFTDDNALFHLHWTAWFLDWASFFNSLPPGSPLFLSLHDTTYISGGCHQLDGCERYQRGCGLCPKLRSASQSDLSTRIFRKKKACLSKTKLYVAANSSYTLTLARQSPLLAAAAGMEVIHPGVNTNVYKPLDQHWCRHMLDIPEDKLVVCFGAASTAYKNKNLDFLIDCINNSPLHTTVFCLVFGSGGEQLRELKCPWRFVGYNDSEHLMASVYCAADIFLMPSRMETFGLTALEALSCGIPVIASNTGGLVDIVQDSKNGILIGVNNRQGWVEAIGYLSRRPDIRLHYGSNGRKRALEHFDIRKIAKQQIAFYSRCMNIN